MHEWRQVEEWGAGALIRCRHGSNVMAPITLSPHSQRSSAFIGGSKLPLFCISVFICVLCG
jgi:hypothetical protein